jgi:hypothetical protein
LLDGDAVVVKLDEMKALETIGSPKATAAAPGTSAVGNIP